MCVREGGQGRMHRPGGQHVSTAPDRGAALPSPARRCCNVPCALHTVPQSLKLIAPAATLTLLTGSAVREYPGMMRSGAMAIIAR